MILRKLDHQWIIALCLEGLAAAVSAMGNPKWEAQLWGAAETIRKAISAPLPPIMLMIYEQTVAAARIQVDEEAFVAAWAEGRSMTPEQALAAQGKKVLTETSGQDQ
ncbi:MAG: hypothetical protein NVSMB27_17110 [Ktedonobacteraceae bacterium]